jgi:hypothetical protein
MLFSLHILLPANTYYVYIYLITVPSFTVCLLFFYLPQNYSTPIYNAYGWFQLGLLKVLGLNFAQEDWRERADWV